MAKDLVLNHTLYGPLSVGGLHYDCCAMELVYHQHEAFLTYRISFCLPQDHDVRVPLPDECFRLHASAIRKIQHQTDSWGGNSISIVYSLPFQDQEQRFTLRVPASNASESRTRCIFLSRLLEAMKEKAPTEEAMRALCDKRQKFQERFGFDPRDLVTLEPTHAVGSYGQEALPLLVIGDQVVFLPEELSDLFLRGADPTEGELKQLRQLILPKAQIDYALRFRSKEEYDAFLIQCTKAGSYPFPVHRHPYLQEGDGLALFVAHGFPIGSFLVTILRHDDADADPRQAKTWLSRVARTQSYERYLRVNHITPGDPRYHPFFRDKNED